MFYFSLKLHSLQATWPNLPFFALVNSTVEGEKFRNKSIIMQKSFKSLESSIGKKVYCK